VRENVKTSTGNSAAGIRFAYEQAGLDDRRVEAEIVRVGQDLERLFAAFMRFESASGF